MQVSRLHTRKSVKEKAGYFGDSAYWCFDEDTGCLTITGIGTIISLYYMGSKPAETSIKSIKIANGITSIGNYAFSGCTGLTSITIPSSVTSIGGIAFSGWTSSQTIYIKTYNSAPIGWDSSWRSNCNATILWGQ